MKYYTENELQNFRFEAHTLQKPAQSMGSLK